MSLYIQARRNSSYLDDLLPDVSIGGIVSELTHPAPERIKSFCRSGGTVLVDPKTFMLQLAAEARPAHFRKLEFAVDFPGLSSLKSEGIGAFVNAVIQAELSHGASELVSPYFLIHEARSPALDLSLLTSYQSREIAEILGISRVWTGLMVAADELKRSASRDWLLTRVTAAPITHCYLLVDNVQDGSGPLRDLELILGLRETVSALSANGIAVLLGYSDPVALGLYVDGLSGFSTGPTVSARRITAKPRGRGGKARPKYYLRPAMNFVRVDDELKSIVGRRLMKGYSCECGCPGTLAKSMRSTNVAMQLHYVRSLRDDAELMSSLTPGTRLPVYRQFLQTASSTYDMLQTAGLKMGGDFGPAHLDAWRVAFS